jgi:nucleoside-diphosphate-sugar epimerase
LVATIAEIMAFSGDIVYDKTKPDGQPRRVLDITRAKTFLDWKPTTSLEDGLRRTVEWYRGLNG